MEERHLPYLAAVHAMQSGVSLEQEMGGGDGSPTSLRVGVNVAMSDHAALVKLLIQKGVITDAEYRAAIEDEMNREVRRYERRLGVTLG